MKLSTKAVLALTAAGAAYAFVQKRKSSLADEASKPIEIHGFVSPGLRSRSCCICGEFFEGGARLERHAACITRAKKWSIFGAG